jgi:bifunctional enzyme CysN/CysC
MGHVDHGKSTVIGRLLHDTGNLREEQVASLRAASATRGLGVEWSFLLDSLQAERDQGVTMDTTQLRLVLEGRAFTIIDAPGHRQFLRNAVTGAAEAAAAVLIVDAAEGAGDQTRRHAMLLHMMGVRHVILLLNKADILLFDATAIGNARCRLREMLGRLAIQPVASIPTSGRHGDNIATRSERTGWYDGPTLAEALIAVPPAPDQHAQPLRLPVQDVYRFDEQRLVVGRIASGRLAVGDSVAIGTLGAVARIECIECWPAATKTAAVAGESVALRLHPDVVVQRGDLLHPPDAAPERATRLRTRLFWLRPEPLRLGEAFRLRLFTAEYPVTVVAIETVLRLDDLTPQPADHVPPEGFADVILAATQPVPFDAFVAGRPGGRGVLVDRFQRIVGGAPLVGPAAIEPTTRALFPTLGTVTPQDRAAARGHGGAVIWLTGLSGAGKTTLARGCEALLFARGIEAVVLDGDTLRARLNTDLGFSDADRDENVRRTAVVAHLMAEAGLVVLVALISPKAAHRQAARTAGDAIFQEVFVRADLATCEARDTKGLYAAARAGRITGFTGIGSGYEAPEAPDMVLDTTADPAAALSERLAEHVAWMVRLA